MWFLLIFFQAFAAPYPATSSSALVSDNSYFFSDWGFEIQKNSLGWTRFVPDQKDPYFLATYRPALAAPDLRASLTIRVDPLQERLEKGSISLSSYIGHWTKQFPKLGLDIQKTEFTIKNGKSAAVIDSLNQETKIQARQYVFWHDDHALIFSCSDRKSDFTASIYACEKIIESLRWTQ